MSLENVQPTRTGRREKGEQKHALAPGRVRMNEGMKEEREFNLSIARFKKRLRAQSIGTRARASWRLNEPMNGRTNKRKKIGIPHATNACGKPTWNGTISSELGEKIDT